MMDEGAFSFEDVEDGSSPPRVTTPFPGAPSSAYPRPGTLFGGSPRPVASGVTRGEKKEETRVGLLHVSDPTAVCGGVIGAVENKKFCAAHPSVCEFQLSHLSKKFQLGTDSLYVMSPRKGSMHATLVPRLDRSCVPKNKTIEDLLNEEKPISVWHVYFDECNAMEEAAGENELEAPRDLSWEADDRPSLEHLEKANDFKTPRKVKVNPTYMDRDVWGKERLPKMEYVIPLDREDIPEAEDDESAVQIAVRQMLVRWDVITTNFLTSQDWMNIHDDLASGAREQLREMAKYMNDIGAKTRLLSARIGRNPRLASSWRSGYQNQLDEVGSRETSRSGKGGPKSVGRSRKRYG